MPMQAHVAIVDDETDLREGVGEYLSRMGVRCTLAANGSELKAIAEREPIDVAILDIAMPGEDGLMLARWLRARGPRPGIILATASGTSDDRIVGLSLGADDYLVKPYDLRELLARIRSLLRRLPATDAAAARPTIGPAAPARQVKIGPYAFDLDARMLSDEQGRPIELTMMEGDLLAALATRPRRVLSRAQLLELAHGQAGENERSIDIRVTRLRKKIEPDPEKPSLIRTVRGEGYLFSPDGA